MKSTAVLILALIILACFLVATHPGPVLGSAPVPQAAPKNLKVLTGMSTPEVNREMTSWTKALGGVKCTYCHKLGDMANDENPKKEIARKMAAMVKTINTDFLTGDTKVNCMTCHRGAAVPTLESSGN